MKKIILNGGCNHEDKGSALRWIAFNGSSLEKDGERECHCGATLKYSI